MQQFIEQYSKAPTKEILRKGNCCYAGKFNYCKFMNRKNTAYRYANFFTFGILKESKDGRAGVFLCIFLAYFIFLGNSLLGMLFLTEGLSILTHNCSLAHAGSPRGCPPRLHQIPNPTLGQAGALTTQLHLTPKRVNKIMGNTKVEMIKRD